MDIKPMSMYFKYEGKARPEIKSASTFDAILAGERTGTTRFPDWYKWNPALYEQLKQIPPGAELKFFDTPKMNQQSRVVTVRTVPTKRSQSLGLGGSAHELTYQDLVDNPQWLELWSKREGWSPSEGLNFFRKYGKGTQIPFELVGDNRIATPVQSPWLIQNNIYSKSPDPFLRALTNPTLRAKDLKYPYEVQYSGYKFADADSAFFGLREALPEDMNLELLADINAAKFMQNPKLMDTLVKRSNGDVESYLNTLVHRTGKNSPKWEGEGLQSRAIQALNTGYSRAVQGQLAVEAQVRDLISKGYDPMQSKSLLRYSSQLRLPLNQMVQRSLILNAQPETSNNRIAAPLATGKNIEPDIFASRPYTPPQRVSPDLGQQYLAMQDDLADLAYAAQSQYGLRDMASSYYP